MQLLNRKITYYSLFIIISTGIYYIENFIRLPLPIFRLGLSHVVTLFLIYKNVKLRDILFIMIMKITLGSLFAGTLISFIYFFALTSNIISVIVQYLFYRFLKKYLSIYSISLVGAEINSFIQLMLLYLFIVKNINILYYFKLIFWVAMTTGMLNAFIANKIIKRINYDID